MNYLRLLHGEACLNPPANFHFHPRNSFNAKIIGTVILIAGVIAHVYLKLLYGVYFEHCSDFGAVVSFCFLFFFEKENIIYDDWFGSWTNGREIV